MEDVAISVFGDPGAEYLCIPTHSRAGTVWVAGTAWSASEIAVGVISKNSASAWHVYLVLIFLADLPRFPQQFSAEGRCRDDMEQDIDVTAENRRAKLLHRKFRSFATPTINRLAKFQLFRK